MRKCNKKWISLALAAVIACSGVTPAAAELLDSDAASPDSLSSYLLPDPETGILEKTPETSAVPAVSEDAEASLLADTPEDPAALPEAEELLSNSALPADAGEADLISDEKQALLQHLKQRIAEIEAGDTGFDHVPAVGAAANQFPMLRLYNPYTGEHFYTSNQTECSSLTKLGWRLEGVGWNAPAAGSVGVYRLYNPAKGFEEHHYTADQNEIKTLTERGWKLEGFAWYSDTSAKTVPVYRLFNPKATRSCSSHHYTTDANEKRVLLSQGWRDEGIAWYALSKGSAQIDSAPGIYRCDASGYYIELAVTSGKVEMLLYIPPDTIWNWTGGTKGADLYVDLVTDTSKGQQAMIYWNNPTAFTVSVPAAFVSAAGFNFSGSYTLIGYDV